MQPASFLLRSICLVTAAAGSISLSTLGIAQGPDSDRTTSQQHEAAVHVDRYGDALPVGAKTRVGTTRLRSGNCVEGIAFSPNGKYVVSSSWEDSIRQWDLKTGELVFRFVTGDVDGCTFGVAFSPDGTKLASVGDRGQVCLWNSQTGSPVWKVLGHAENNFGVRVYGVVFSPDGLTIATAGDDKSIRLWEVATGTQLLDLPSDEGGSGTRPVAFSPDGNLLATGNGKGAIQIWNLAEGSEEIAIPKAHERDIVSVIFTKDGKRLISSGIHLEPTGERSVRIVSEIRAWNVANGKQEGSFDADDKLLGYSTLAISADGRFLASSHFGKIVIWDVNTGEPIRAIRGDEEYYGGRSQNLAISPDGKLVAAGTFGAGSNKLYLWNVDTGQAVLPQTDTHVEAVLTMDLSPDRTTVATASADGSVRLWDADSGEHMRLIDNGSGSCRYVEFFPDGKSIALGRETHAPGKPFEGEVKICRVADGKELHQFQVPDRVMCGALSPGGAGKLAVGIGLGDEMPFGRKAGSVGPNILVWDTRTGAKISGITGSKNQIQQLQFTADGEALWSTSSDQVAHKWSVTDGAEIESHHLGADGPRGFVKTLIVPGTSRILQGGLERIDRSASRGKLSSTDFNHNEAGWNKAYDHSWPKELAVSADGELLAAYLSPLSGSQAKKRIAVFSANDGRELQSFGLDDGAVRSLGFSRDGNLLLSGMEAGDGLLWDVSPARQTLQHTNP